MTKPSEPDALDPHGLLAKGEPIAPEAELARLLGVSRAELHSLLQGPLRPLVRFVRAPPPGGQWRYCIADARAAIVSHLPLLEERRKAANEQREREMDAAEKRRADRQTAHLAHMAAKQARSRKRPAGGSSWKSGPSARPAVDGPRPRDGAIPTAKRTTDSKAFEVIVRRKPSAG